MDKLQEDTVSADRKERIIFDPNTGKSRKISSVVSRQNFNNAKYGHRNKKDGDINFVTGTAPVAQVKEELKSFSSYKGLEKEDKPGAKKTEFKGTENSVKGDTVEGWKDEQKPVKEEAMTLDEQIVEVLSKDASAGAWIHDFIKSDNPKFEGKSKEKRKEMALAAYYAKQRNESVEPKKEDDEPPFEPDLPKKNADALAGKYGQGYSTARHLARMGLKQQQDKQKSTNEGTDMSKLTFNQFVEQLDELVEFVPEESLDEGMTATKVAPGVTRYTGGSYGNAKGAKYGNTNYDKETLETKDDDEASEAKPAAAAPVKRGRGRPAGSYGTYKARSAETRAAAAAKSAASKAASKAKAK